MISSWSPNFQPLSDDDDSDTMLPSVLHPLVLEEPLLPHHNSSNPRTSSFRSQRTSNFNSNPTEELLLSSSSSSSSTLVDRAHTLTENVKFRLLAQLVGDGLHTRQFAVDLKTTTALWYYEYSHSSLSRGIYSLAMALFLILVFIEAPSSNSFVTRTALISPDITVPIEILLISIVWADVYAQVRYQDSEWRKQLCRRTWLRGRIFVATVITVDLMCTVWTPGIVRFSRPFRVWLLLSRMRNLRNAISMAVRTLPNVALIGTFLVFLVLLFSIVGWLIFDPANEPWKTIAFNQTKSGLCSTFTPVCNGYFDTFPNTLYQMWILLGGINYPAVALPYLEVSFFSAFFFVAYLTLGQIFLMRLLITAAYGAYREELFKRIQKRETRTHTAFSSAFYILTDSRNSNNCTNGIVLKEWLRLVKQVRPKFRKEVARAIFHAAEEVVFQEVDHGGNDVNTGNNTGNNGTSTSNERNENNNNNNNEKQNMDTSITKEDGTDSFLNTTTNTGNTGNTSNTKQNDADPLSIPLIPTSSSISSSISSLSPSSSSSPPLQPLVTSYDRFVEMLHMLDVQIGKRQMHSRNKWNTKTGCLGCLRRTSWSTYRIRWVRRSFDMLALFSVFRLILVRTRIAPDYGRCVEHYTPACSLDIIGYGVMSLFCLEQIIKILALGFREYWLSWLNRLDFSVSAISVTATFIIDLVAPLNHANIFLTLAQILPIIR